MSQSRCSLCKHRKFATKMDTYSSYEFYLICDINLEDEPNCIGFEDKTK